MIDCSRVDNLPPPAAYFQVEKAWCTSEVQVLFCFPCDTSASITETELFGSGHTQSALLQSEAGDNAHVYMANLVLVTSQ